MERKRHAAAWAALAAVLTLCASLFAVQTGNRHSRRAAPAGGTLRVPPRPSGCSLIAAGAAIQPQLDAAPPSSSLCLQPGHYVGPLVIRRALTLWGPREAVIQSAGEGSTIAVMADRTRLLGFTIHGSGRRFDRNDSGVRVSARHIQVEGLRIENALFGITVEKSEDVTLRGNTISGDSRQSLGLRGDAIRLWETRDSLLEDNLVSYCRDILIWYSERNRLIRNRIIGGRYGTHFMFSKDETVENSLYSGNVVGIFAMYSHDVVVRGSRIWDSTGGDGMGIGIKDSDGLAVMGNALLHDNIGIYLDASPAETSATNAFSGNLLALNMIAVSFHAGEANTIFRSNSFRDNQSVLTVEGQDDALQSQWNGNYYDDYQGYDLDRDGRGDVPYELRSFSTELPGHYPLLAFFAGSPALSVMNFLGRAFPLLQPKLLMIDRSPRMYMPLVNEDLRED